MNYNVDTFIKIIKIGRPHVLAGDFLLFTMGTLLALLFDAEFFLSKFLLGYSILFTAHLAVHYSNDYFDVEVDRYNHSNAISSGRGVLVENPGLREFSKGLSITLMVLSVSLAAVFMVIFTYPLSFFLFFLSGNLLAWFYTAPPIKLAYRRMGEIANMVAVIIFLGAGYFAMMGTLDLPFLIFSIPVVFLQLIFINSFEIPDMVGDKLGGKITWIVSWGCEFGFRLIALFAALATLSFLLIPFTNLFPPNIDFQVLAAISLIILALGIIELLENPLDKESATKFSTINVFALFLMSILIDAYFLYLVS